MAGNDLVRDASRIDKLVRDARETRPCIIFIDEADDILADRSGHRGLISGSATNKLLTAMDGAAGKPRDVVWIAATNHPEGMDPAALRAGRFTEKVQFDLPDEDQIGQMVREWIARSRARFAPDVTPAAVAAMFRRIEVNAADVSAILQHAVNTLVVRNLQQKTVKHVTLFDVNAAVASVKIHSA